MQKMWLSMDRKPQTSRQTYRWTRIRCFSLLSWTLYECYLKNVGRRTQHNTEVDTQLQQWTCPSPRTADRRCRSRTWWDVALSEKKNKLWIWKAFCRDTGELIAWECGDRDKATLKKLLTRLENWQVKVYYTDDWKPYKSLIPSNLLVQTKAETHAIERNNCQMRHWFGRFKRKSIIVSKSVEMVNATIALFARFRVNGDVSDILKIGQTQLNIII